MFRNTSINRAFSFCQGGFLRHGIAKRLSINIFISLSASLTNKKSLKILLFTLNSQEVYNVFRCQGNSPNGNFHFLKKVAKNSHRAFPQLLALSSFYLRKHSKRRNVSSMNLYK